MSDGEISLSICIATFNRGKYISETLSTIVDQLDERTELIVLDGGSTDDTQSLMLAFADRYPQLRYVREATNSGVDQDFDKAVHLANGRYVWLMTDDDLMMPGAVNEVLSAIQHNQDLIIVNAEVGNADFSRVLSERLYPASSDLVYFKEDATRFFVETAQCLTFIGATVIKRELWLSRERQTYYGSLFIHVGVIFQSPPLERVQVIASPQVRIRYGNAMWTARSFAIWMFKWPQLIWSFDAFDTGAKEQIVAMDPWRNWRKLFQYRAKNAYSSVEYRQHFSDLPDRKYRLVARCISVFPVWLANALSLLYLIARKQENLIPIYDLVNTQPFLPIRRLLTKVYRF